MAARLAGDPTLAGHADPALLTLGALAGVAAAVAWRGTPALVLAAGAALLVAGLDSVEGQSQEADHTVRRDSLPVHPGRLLVRHLAAPAVVMTVVVLAGVGGAMVLGDPATVVQVAAVIGLPAALAATCGAALSVETGPGNPFALEPFHAVRLFVRSVGPGVLAVTGVLPVLAARAAAGAGHSPTAGAVPAAAGVLVVVAGAVAWLRRST
ncbi:MAG: hypothetical protein ACR2HM_01805 [Acidimicrobiales bacterium]